jgi:hypothetical protein
MYYFAKKLNFKTSKEAEILYYSWLLYRYSQMFDLTQKRRES